MSDDVAVVAGSAVASGRRSRTATPSASARLCSTGSRSTLRTPRSTCDTQLSERSTSAASSFCDIARRVRYSVTRSPSVASGLGILVAHLRRHPVHADALDELLARVEERTRVRLLLVRLE